MRKTALALTAGLLAISLVSPASGGPNDRTVTKEYTMANGMVIYESTSATWSVGTAWKVFRPKPGERFVSISISDDLGRPVFGHTHFHQDGDGEVDEVDFCNETPKPIRLGAAKKLEVAVFLGTCPDGTPSLVTQGTVTATFSR